MEDFSKKITFFRSLGQQENLETTPRNSVHRTSKLKIPDIFISSVSQKQTEAKQEYVEKKEPKIENKSPQLGKYISQSVGSHLNLLENERKPLTKSQSQEMFAVLEDEDNINGDKLPEKRDSAGLHKSKGFEDLPLAALKDESVIPKEEFPTPSEEPNNKPHVLNIIPKKIELHLSDDTTIEFRKRDNMLQPNRTQSLIEKRTNQEKNAELFIEKLRQIKDKRRSAEFNTPRTFLFDFTGRQDKSKSDNNLNTIVDTDNSKAEFQDQNNNEEVTKKDGLKIIPKEIRNRSMELDKQQENNEEALQIKVPTLEDITEKNKEIENSRYEEYVNVAEPIKIVIPVDSDIIINTEEENGNEITSEINGIVLETDKDISPRSPVPAPRKVSSPVMFENEEFMSTSEISQNIDSTSSSEVKHEDVITIAFDNKEYITKEDIQQNIIPKPAPRSKISNSKSETDLTTNLDDKNE